MKKQIDALIEKANNIIIGKDAQIRMSLACLFAKGHLLIEDLPGMGKTTLAHLLAQLLGLQFNRIQFTSDLLPSDIIGASIYNKDNGSFSFHPGPLFTQVVLADEINRATPKAQSSLLEAMEERQVSVEGETTKLPEPFFVIATQNPAHHVGTFPLPESQYDRFLMRIELGYPDRNAERSILQGRDRRDLLTELNPAMTPEQVMEIQNHIPQVHVSDALLDYLQDLVDYTRTDPFFGTGLSPRGSLALLHSAKSWAYLEGRDHVLPEDIQQIISPVVTHRLRHGIADPSRVQEAVARLKVNIPIP